MPAKKEKKWTEEILIEFIENTYGQDKGWLVLDHVRSHVSGFARTADAVAFGMWPSRGQLIMGFEVKISKGDWQRELFMPEKADEIAQYCDKWWIVAPPGLISIDELPEKWGLLEPARKNLKIIKQAQDLETEFQQLPRQFVSCIFRRFVEKVKKPSRDDLRNEYRKGLTEGVDRAAMLDLDEATKRIVQDYKNLKERVEKFETTSGIDVGERNFLLQYQAENLKWLLENTKNLQGDLPQTINNLKKTLTTLEEARKHMGLKMKDASRW